jgi:hypothetical protein
MKAVMKIRTVLRHFAFVALVALVATVALAQTKRASMTVFGVELGKALSLPECAINPRMKALGEVVYEVTMDGPEALCFERDSQPPLGSGETVVEEPITINFPASKCPDDLMASGGSLQGQIMAGKLEEVSFFTAGAGTEKHFLRVLEEKYGSPSSLRTPRMQTIGGARVDAMEAVWNLTSLKITFKSALQDIDQGSVVIQTRIAAAREAAKIPKGPKL